MSKNRIIVISVVVEGRTKAEVARDYGITYRWVHTLVQRYLAGGWEALERQHGASPSVSHPRWSRVRDLRALFAHQERLARIQNDEDQAL